MKPHKHTYFTVVAEAIDSNTSRQRGPLLFLILPYHLKQAKHGLPELASFHRPSKECQFLIPGNPRSLFLLSPEPQVDIIAAPPPNPQHPSTLPHPIHLLTLPYLLPQYSSPSNQHPTIPHPSPTSRTKSGSRNNNPPQALSIPTLRP